VNETRKAREEAVTDGLAEGTKALEDDVWDLKDRNDVVPAHRCGSSCERAHFRACVVWGESILHSLANRVAPDVLRLVPHARLVAVETLLQWVVLDVLLDGSRESGE